MDERIVSPESTEQEEIIEKSLRPQTLAQYIGQDKVKQELSIYIQAAKIEKKRWIMSSYMVRQA